MNNVTNLPTALRTNPWLKERRIEMLEELIGVLAIIYEHGTNATLGDPFVKFPDLSARLTKCSLNFEKYGNKQERAAMENFIQALKNSPQTGNRPLEIAYDILAPIALQNLRAELGVED